LCWAGGTDWAKLGRDWAKEKVVKRDREGEFEGGFGTLSFLCFFSFLSFSTHINQKQIQQNKCNTYTHLFYFIYKNNQLIFLF
jgi:hypothetical protein